MQVNDEPSHSLPTVSKQSSRTALTHRPADVRVCIYTQVYTVVQMEGQHCNCASPALSCSPFTGLFQGMLQRRV